MKSPALARNPPDGLAVCQKVPDREGRAMAKKDKKGDKSGKSDKSKTPKKVAGVKVPKALRNQGDTIASLITSPVARELLADALIAVAGVLAGNKKTREAVADAGSQAASSAKEMGKTATGAVADVVTEAARRILPSSFTGEDADRKTEAREAPRPARASAGGAGRKKKDRETRGEGRPGFIE